MYGADSPIVQIITSQLVIPRPRVDNREYYGVTFVRQQSRIKRENKFDFPLFQIINMFRILSLLKFVERKENHPYTIRTYSN